MMEIILWTAAIGTLSIFIATAFAFGSILGGLLDGIQYLIDKEKKDG